MFGIRKWLMVSVFLVSCSLGVSEEDGFFWKMFSRGKSILENLKNINKSERRTEDGSIGTGSYQDTEPEHREVDIGHAPVSYDNYYGDYTGHTQIIHRDNMELYSLLGGLSFASLLATTLVILTRRNGSLLRSSRDDLFRNNGQGQGAEDYQLVIKLPQILYRMGKHLSRPWWWWSSSGNRETSKGFRPFSLVHPELVNHND